MNVRDVVPGLESFVTLMPVHMLEGEQKTFMLDQDAEADALQSSNSQALLIALASDFVLLVRC